MSNAGYIKGFDGLRAISIVMVLLTHLGWDDNFNPKIKENLSLVFSGTVGVNVFFVLSGFLITQNLLKEFEISQTINLKRFYFKRLLRLMPAFWAFLIVVFLLMQFHQIPDVKPALLFAFFYCYNYIPHTIYFSELVHTWSLSVEEQFYLVWPAILLVFGKKTSFYISWVIVLFSFLFIAISFQTTLGQHYNIERFFIPASASILLGCIAAFLIKNEIKNYGLKTILLGTFVFLSPLFLTIFHRYFLTIIQAAGTAMILIYIFQNQNALLTKGLNNRIFNFVGVLSYSLYMWQGLFLRTGSGSEIWFQQFPQNLVFSFLAAIVSFYAIERYFLKWKSQL